jgi:hypothetical protein
MRNPKKTAGRMDRRDFLRESAIAAIGFGLLNRTVFGADDQPATFRLATFSADVTIPMGHPCMGGGIAPAKAVRDPLEARGVVLMQDGAPAVVIVAVDWCEIRNDAYERWRDALADAAGTNRKRVFVSSVHQHDAPVVDLRAEHILREHKARGSVCDPAFHEVAVQRVAAALKESLKASRPITHVGTGKAKVDRVASNRRYLDPDGHPAFGRTSATRDAHAREEPEGTIDPFLRTLSFWNGDQAIAALNVYATHPMSRYGEGMVSADFVGDARRKRQKDDPAIFQIYLSGASGNVTAGKYNDGSPENRAILADRIHRGMVDAWEDTERHAITSAHFRCVPLPLKPREEAGFSVAELTRTLTTDPNPFHQCLAAMGLSWRNAADAGKVIDLPVIDFGFAQWLLLPGESYVEFQLLAQSLRPGSFIVVTGYGECATGYVPTGKAIAEHDGNLRDWCWVAPGSEEIMTKALKDALKSS